MPHHKSKHIVMVTKGYPPWMGGIERHVRDLSEELVKRGWRVTALVCGEDRVEQRETINGVDVIRVARFGTILSQPLVSGYSRTLCELKPDIIHTHVPFPLAWVALRTIAASVPVVCTWHSDIVRQRWLMGILSPIEQKFLRRCAEIFVTSPELLQSSKALQPLKTKCKIVPLALPPVITSPQYDLSALWKRAGIKHENLKQIVLFVGRLVGYKGVRYLIDAMQSIDADLLIAGNGPLKTTLQQQAKEQPNADRIHFVGAVSEEEKTALYQTADLFALPSVSRNEAFGYVLLEAMREGCPVLSTDLTTGVRWVNQHETTGLVVPPCDSNALSSAINRILADDRFRIQCSGNAKKRVNEIFRFEDTIDQIEQRYRNLSRS